MRVELNGVGLQKQFEELFLRDSAQFYRQASQKFLEENCASVYVRKVNECLAEESQRADRYLDKTTESKIVDVLNAELVTKHMVTVVEMENSGLVHMLLNDKIEDLHELYELLKRVPNGVKTVMETLSRFLRKKGQLLVDECNAEVPAPSGAVGAVEGQTKADGAEGVVGGGGGAGGESPAANPLGFIQVGFGLG